MEPPSKETKGAGGNGRGVRGDKNGVKHANGGGKAKDKNNDNDDTDGRVSIQQSRDLGEKVCYVVFSCAVCCAVLCYFVLCCVVYYFIIVVFKTMV